mgnify:FL=1
MTENPTDRVSHEPTQVPAGALAAGESMRIDTWLWATRHVKSRSQATSAARAGHVKINGESVKAAQKVRVGDEVRLRVEGFDRVLIVRKLIVKRLGYPFAKLCYEDLSEPRPRLGVAFAQRERGSGRPTKKERRDMEKFRGKNPDFSSEFQW